MKNIIENKEKEGNDGFSKDLLLKIIETSPDGLIVVNNRGKILLANAQMENLFGYQKSEMVGQNVELFLPSNLRSLHEIHTDNYIQNASPRKVYTGRELFGQKKGGELFPVEINLSPFEEGPDGMFVTASIRDNTTRKELLEELNFTFNTLENTNKDLRQFAFIASHGLKTMIRGIGSLISFLEIDYKDKHDSKAKGYIRQIKERVTLLYNSLEEIFKYSTLASLKDKVVEIDTSELITNVIHSLRKSDDIEIFIQDNIPSIYLKKKHAKELFYHLIENAIIHRDQQKGFVKISGNYVKESDSYIFTIEDNGIGIEEKYFDKIFEIFQKLNPSTEHASSGLGLPIVKKITELYGGNIEVKSTFGKGSVFTLTIPKIK